MNALISVWRKDGLLEFVRGLIDLGYEIYATEGTARFLRSHGLDVRRLSEITGMTESKHIKTLHPEVFKRIYDGFFKIVVVNLYEDEMDVGGVAVLRAGVKMYKDVLVVCDPRDYKSVLERIGRGVNDEFKLKLAMKALEYIIDYDRRFLDKLKENYSIEN